MSEFQVRRDDLNTTRIGAARADAETQLESGQVLVKVDLFSFTANNMTYGQVGDQLGYWQFFPVADEGWGVIPVWGFADVVASRHDDVPVGERLYGYFPPGGHVVMTPGRVGAGHVIDGTPHRHKLPIGYNTYARVLHEPGYDPRNDAWRALLYPLFITSFCLWDALSEAEYHGAERIVILSASSKTALGLGYALAGDGAAPRVVGVTSPRSVALLEEVAVYDEVLTYDALAQVDADVPTVIVDMAGNGALLGALHRRLGSMMLATIQVGVTHRAEVRDEGIDVARSGFFFAPSHIERRMAEWGPAGFAQRSGGFMARTTGKCAAWMHLRDVTGAAGLQGIYPSVADGTLPAHEAVIVRM